MRYLFITLIFLLLHQIANAQFPPWNLEFYVYHPDGHTDTLWIGCDENATAGYDEGLDIIDTTFNTPIAIRGYSQEVEDEFNFGACVNLKKDIRPFGYPAEFTFYILHDSIYAADNVYLGWDTSTLNYEVGDYWIEGAVLYSSYGYLEGIDGTSKFLCSRGSLDSILDYGYQPIPIYSLAEKLPCFNNSGYSEYYLKIVLKAHFKDYGVYIDSLTSIPNNIYFYPNPSTSNLQVESNIFQIVQAFIYDISGNLIDTILIKPGIQLYDISSLPRGNYIIKSFSEETKHQFTYKFIKQ
ncbi:MAG TPA: T9SS type A sorting domain-containing protein [Chitinophagales bacterium]|nr:T9SS type A sorting domain-containing protein [Chitinophagales bacterium]